MKQSSPPLPKCLQEVFDWLEVIGMGCSETRHLIRSQGGTNRTFDSARQIVKVMEQLSEAIADAEWEAAMELRRTATKSPEGLKLAAAKKKSERQARRIA